MPISVHTYRTVESTTPWTVPSKSSAYASPSQPYQPSPVYGKLSQPPPSRSESITTGGGTYSVPSRTQSVSSDLGSENGSASRIDALEYMNERLARVMDATPLDRSLAMQAQKLVVMGVDSDIKRASLTLIAAQGSSMPKLANCKLFRLWRSLVSGPLDETLMTASGQLEKCRET